MKYKSFFTILTLALSANFAQAQGDKASNIVNQDLSKRPYQAPADSNANEAKDDWDGATLVTKENDDVKKGPSKYQQLRIRMLGQRPYMEKSTD